MDFHFKGTELALWSSACVIFGWLIKSHFSSGNELRKQNFRTAITNLREQFGLVRDEMLVEAHAQSLPRVREECAKIKGVVGRRQWEALTSATSAYSGLTKNDIENRDLNSKGGNGPAHAAPANYSLGRNRLTELLDQMLRQVD